MSQTQYRINLAAKDFSFLAAAWGRSVILKQYDQNFSRQIVSPTDPDKDIGIPQIYYCHNVMPSSGGFQSVGLNQLVVAAVTLNNFCQVINYTYSGDIRGMLGFALVGDGFDVYDLKPGANWTFVAHVTSLVPSPGNFPITIGTAEGVNYIYFPYTSCFTWDGTTWAVQVLTGITATDIRGVSDSFGYLIVWSNSEVSWSSTVDPTDFTPSLITGAGGGSVEGLLGNIDHCESHVYGFIVFSAANAVASIYSGNAQYPFNFRVLVGAGGLVYPQLIGVDPDSGNLFAWTTKGLQIMSTTQAANVHPELVNFINGSRFEDFNEITNTFIETDVAVGSIGKALKVVANRYMVISYGLKINTVTGQYIYTHAMVYDAAMKRWGKLRIPHIQCFDFDLQSTTVAGKARGSISFVDQNGICTKVDLSFAGPGNGVLLLGKYQHTRNRYITLQEVAVEGIFTDDDANTLSVIPTLDGKTLLPAIQLTATDDSTYPQPDFQCRITGLNFSLLFKGGFNLDSVVLAYIPNGRR